MNIAYSCNDNYIEQTGVSIISLLENNKNIKSINIILISIEISIKNKELISTICEQYGRKLEIICFSTICSNVNFVEPGRHIVSIYAKLFFGNLRDFDKIIYLDSDTIITKSMQNFWDINIDAYCFGMVKTITKSATLKLGLLESDHFFNDGVALVNCKRLREENYEEKFIKFIKDFNGAPPFFSEGVVNAVCKDKILSIPFRFNYLSAFFLFNADELSMVSREREFISHSDFNIERENIVVVHYLAEWFGRPWFDNCTHPLKELYIHYKEKSPWKCKSFGNEKLELKKRINRFVYRAVGSSNFVKLWLIKNDFAKK